MTRWGTRPCNAMSEEHHFCRALLSERTVFAGWVEWSYHELHEAKLSYKEHHKATWSYRELLEATMSYKELHEGKLSYKERHEDTWSHMMLDGAT